MNSDDDLDQLLLDCEEDVDSWPDKAPVQQVSSQLSTLAGVTDLGAVCESLNGGVDLPATPESACGGSPKAKHGEPPEPGGSCIANNSQAALTPSGSPQLNGESKANTATAAVIKQKPSFVAKAKSKTSGMVAKHMPKFGSAKLTKHTGNNNAGGKRASKNQKSTEDAPNPEVTQLKQSEPAATDQGKLTGETETATTEKSTSVSEKKSPGSTAHLTSGSKVTKPSFAVKQAIIRRNNASKKQPTNKPKSTCDTKPDGGHDPNVDKEMKTKRKDNTSQKRAENQQAKAAKLEEKVKAKEEQLQKKAAKLQEKEEKAQLKEEKRKLAEEKRQQREEKKCERATKQVAMAQSNATAKELPEAAESESDVAADMLSAPREVDGEETCHAERDDCDSDSVSGSITSLDRVALSLEEAAECCSDAETPCTSDDGLDSAQQPTGSASDPIDVYNLELEWNDACDRWVDNTRSPSDSERKKSKKRKRKNTKKRRQKTETGELSSDDDRIPAMASSGLENNGEKWVECTVCEKWRRLRGTVDTATLPATWSCSMNSDSKWNTCDVDEENWQEMDDSYTFAPCDHTPGSVVWARINGYPWWPGLVDVDPSEEAFARFESDDDYAIDSVYEPVQLHIVFGFDPTPTRAWVDKSNVKELDKSERPPDTVTVKASQRKQMKSAAAIACNCLSLPIEDRISMFGHDVSMRARSRKRRSSQGTSNSNDTHSPNTKRIRASQDSSFCSAADTNDALDLSDVLDELELPGSPEY